jgi:hypothetical protein
LNSLKTGKKTEEDKVKKLLMSSLCVVLLVALVFFSAGIMYSHYSWISLVSIAIAVAAAVAMIVLVHFKIPDRIVVEGKPYDLYRSFKFSYYREFVSGAAMDYARRIGACISHDESKAILAWLKEQDRHRLRSLRRSQILFIFDSPKIGDGLWGFFYIDDGYGYKEKRGYWTSDNVFPDLRSVLSCRATAVMFIKPAGGKMERANE